MLHVNATVFKCPNCGERVDYLTRSECYNQYPDKSVKYSHLDLWEWPCYRQQIELKIGDRESDAWEKEIEPHITEVPVTVADKEITKIPRLKSLEPGWGQEMDREYDELYNKVGDEEIRCGCCDLPISECQKEYDLIPREDVVRGAHEQELMEKVKEQAEAVDNCCCHPRDTIGLPRIIKDEVQMEDRRVNYGEFPTPRAWDAIWGDELDLKCDPYPMMVDSIHVFNGAVTLMGIYGQDDKIREIW